LGVGIKWSQWIAAYRALDRSLGGERRPTRVQRYTARRPGAMSIIACTPLVTFFLLLVLMSHGSWGDAILAAGLGLCLAPVYYPLALLERRRQRRLVRLGLWRGTDPKH
jgi:hypothetical protein